jgi:hypothetical protein
MYAIIGVIGLLIYYPLATYLYASLQFQDKSLDFKYRPSYIVLLSQLKLVIGGLNSFFNQNKIIVVLVAGLAIMVFCAIYVIAKKPCLIKKINYIDFATYITVAWV